MRWSNLPHPKPVKSSLGLIKNVKTLRERFYVHYRSMESSKRVISSTDALQPIVEALKGHNNAKLSMEQVLKILHMYIYIDLQFGWLSR